MNPPLLSIQNLSFAYPGGAPVITNFNLVMTEGSIMGISGPSGAGKTTLFNLIAGFEKPDSGTILLEDRVLSSPDAIVPVQNRGIGVVFQDFALFPHLTVAQNILFGLHHVPGSVRETTLKTMLDLTELQEMAARFPHELSGGQKQRVAIARALAPNPRILLMDECFSNIEEDLTRSLIDQTCRIFKTRNSTVLVVSHNREELALLCDSTLTLAGKSPQETR